MRKKAILVTGASGEIGQALIRSLLEKYTEPIITLDIQPVPDELHSKVVCIQGDILDKALLSRLEEGDGEPGTVLDEGLLIACGEGAVRVMSAQREGRGVQSAADLLRGFPIPPGTKLRR